MPCRDYQDEINTKIEYRTEYKTDPKISKRLNDATRNLCMVMKDIKKNAPRTYNRLMQNKSLNKWWVRHQKEDKKRGRKIK